MVHRFRASVGMLSLGICVLIMLPGCAAQRFAPHMGFGSLYIETQIDRDDIVVLDRVEGTSSATSVFFGIVQVIDGDKVKVFGIPFFKEKYVWYQESPVQQVGRLVGVRLPGFVTPASRAYYKALEAHPEADAVFCKSLEREEGGIPWIYHTETVTFKGKAVKLQSDR